VVEIEYTCRICSVFSLDGSMVSYAGLIDGPSSVASKSGRDGSWGEESIETSKVGGGGACPSFAAFDM
jgi:hypothetical protein